VRAGSLDADQVDSSADPEREEWLRLSQEYLANAFEDDEPEYPLSLIKEPNPDFEKG
jgi:hypothetical protein